MTGRPCDYTPELAARICAAIADGQSMRTVCAGDDMPSMATVFRWLHEQREGFQEQYTRATAERAEALVEDMQAIADNPLIEPNDKRIRVDTRKWIASKLKPKKYGDKIAVTDNEGGPLQVSWLAPAAPIGEPSK